MLSFCCAYDIPWIFQWSYMLNQHTGSGVHRLLRQASIKWWPKFNEDLVSKDSELPIPPQSYDVDECSVFQRKLKETFKGIPRNEIL